MASNQDCSLHHIKEIYSYLMHNLDFSPKSPVSVTSTTHKALLSAVAEYNDGGKWFPKMCDEAASIAELFYSHCSSEIRVHMAIFVWCLINIEDLGHKYPSSLASFQGQVLRREKPENKVLETFMNSLTAFYDFWDPIQANGISLSAIEFINGVLLEQAPNVLEMQLSSPATNWPYFLRRKTGISAAFCFAVFPNELNIDLSAYIQAIEDTSIFLDIFNDTISFYKEHDSGERNNYVHNRAHVNQKSFMEALQDTANDAVAAYTRAKNILQNTEAYLPWKSFTDGFISFHFVHVKRYRLEELGFQLDGSMAETNAS